MFLLDPELSILAIRISPPINSHAISPSTCLILSSRLSPTARPFTSWRHRRPVFSPRIGTCGVRVSDAYRHRCKPFTKSSFTANRPPVVQENLERAPHRDPAADRKAFANDFANPAALHQSS